MQIANGFILREIVGTWVVVPLGGKLVEFNGLIQLSESSALLWKQLEKNSEIDELVQTLTENYDVSYAEARDDVEAFLNELRQRDLLV